MSNFYKLFNMKNLTLSLLVLLSFGSISCNQEIEWNDKTRAEFKNQCLNKMAKQYKAEDPDEFCKCFVDRLEAEKMGVMDMIKSSVKLAKDCGANLEGL